jgi:hypothetical protein
MSTPTTPTDAPFNPGKYALEALVAAGDLDAAGKLAVKLTAATPAAAPAPPPVPTDGLLDYKTMRGMTMQEMADLTSTPEGDAQIQSSLKALRASGERHNAASSKG